MLRPHQNARVLYLLQCLERLARYLLSLPLPRWCGTVAVKNQVREIFPQRFKLRRAGATLVTFLQLLCEKAVAHIEASHFCFIGTLSSGSSVDTASEPELSLATKTKGGDIGLNGHGTPITFSHHYSEEAPSAGKKKIQVMFKIPHY